MVYGKSQVSEKKMMKFAKLVLVVGCLSFFVNCSLGAEQEFKRRFRRLDVKEYVNRMKAGWIGQMAGVGWAGPTEFSHKGLIIPADKMPQWEPAMINQFDQDDLYVDKTHKQWPPTGDGLGMTIGAGDFKSILEWEGIAVSGSSAECAYRYWDADWALLISCTTTDGNDFALSAGEWTNLNYNQRGTVNLEELSTLDFRVTWTDDAAEGKGGTWTVEYDDNSTGWETLCMIDSSTYTQDATPDRHVEFWVNPHIVGVTANVDVDRYSIKGQKASAR